MTGKRSKSRRRNSLRAGLGEQYWAGNKFACGSTRSGKSMSAVNDIVAAANDGNVAIVCCDPHRKSLAWNSFMQLVARGHQHRIIYDQIPYFERVPTYQFLTPSVALNLLRRASQNEQTAQQFAEILCRRGNRGSLSQSPLTEEWTMKAANLLLNQAHPCPASDLRYAFLPGHPVHNRLVRNCTDELIKFEFSQVTAGTTKRGQYAPAARLIEGVCGSPAFQARCGNSFNLSSFLDDAGILLIEGGEDGVAPEVTQTVMASMIMQVIQYVRQRRFAIPRVLLVIDEATNANLVSKHEARAMAECQKNGLDIHVLVQLLDFPSAEICNGVLSNAVRHEWFYNANPNVVRKAIDDLGLNTSDIDCVKEFKQLKQGERYVKWRSTSKEFVWREQVELLPNLWVFPRLAQKKSLKALSEVRKRAEYRSPSVDELQETGQQSTPLLEEPTSAAENLIQRLKEVERTLTDPSND